MAFVPFTIFFMTCLTVFHGSLATPHGCRKSREWPDGCANAAYCFEMPTNYPNTTELQKMFDNSGFDISKLETQKPVDRVSNGPCRQYYMVDPIYVIKDAENTVHYVVQDPNLLIQRAPILPCKKQVDLAPLITCKEELGTWEFVVMTCDGKGVEKIQFSIPFGCSARQVNDYDD